MRLLAFFIFLPAAFGQLFSTGIKIGVPVTDPFSNFNIPGSTAAASIHSFSDSKGFLVGPTVELHLPFGFSISADGIYRPVHLTTVSVLPNGVAAGTVTSTYSSWEVTPALRYRFLHTPIIKPFAEGGPSFRFLNAPFSSSTSDRGFTLGAGVEVKILRLRIAPELRYTRWGSDHSLPFMFPVQSNQNQAEFLAGFTF